MNRHYIKMYVDIDGQIKNRCLLSQIRIILFTIIKFLFDRVFSIIGIILLLPLFIIIAIAIKIDSKGPILYKQARTGKNGKIFKLYKYRTMIENNDIYDFTTSDKYTRVGKILRRTSLDELPQLILIAIGKMSFVGPRPWIPEYYEKMNDIQKHKYDVTPGLTGLAQIMGRNNLSIFQKIDYDNMYIKNYSLIQDIKIMLLTIKILFKGVGINAGKNTIKSELDDLKKQNFKKNKKVKVG